MSHEIRRVGILTGGGDCPGLNAVIRAVAKAAMTGGLQVVGIEDGYLGLIENRMRVLGAEDVSGILTRGGTILGSSRTNPYKKEESVAQLLQSFQRLGLTALVAIFLLTVFRPLYRPPAS